MNDARVRCSSVVTAIDNLKLVRPDVESHVNVESVCGRLQDAFQAMRGRAEANERLPESFDEAVSE